VPGVNVCPLPRPQANAKLPPRMDRTSHVYLMTNQSGTLYLGVTTNLAKRISAHKAKATPSFTKKYNVTRDSDRTLSDNLAKPWTALPTST
jgi:hypothetical protein